MKVLAVFGTRPEAVKIAPVVHSLRNHDGLDVRICLSGQHRDMVDHIMQVFGIEADYDADIMQEDQEPVDLASRAISALGKIYEIDDPDLVVLQGDTTTAFAAALAAFYRGVRCAHIEAGLRTSTRWKPFPEEINRRLISQVAELHFAPTKRSAEALSAEGINESTIFVTGNTVIDALRWLVARPASPAMTDEVASLVEGAARMILVTAHRRAHFGKPLRTIARALNEIVERNADVKIVYPVHPNPNVREVADGLRGVERITLTDPLPYETFVRVMQSAYLVLTDSGGLQEEAPALGKPVLVMREETERGEGVAEGVARVVGLERESIVNETQLLLDDSERYSAMARPALPYGDGRAAERIANVIDDFLGAGR